MSGSGKLRGILAAGALSLVVAIGGGPSGPAEARAPSAAAAGATSVVGERPADPSARAAKTISLDETGHLHLTSKHGFTLNEQGTASGTAPGTIYVHLTAVSTSRVTAEVNIYPSGGSISGHGTGSYHRGGTTASFNGTISFDRGTGRYAGAHGSGLSFDGTIAESSHDAITVQVHGRVSD